MTLEFNACFAVVEILYMFVQNFIKQSAVVRELLC